MTKTYCYRCKECEAQIESDQFHLTHCSVCDGDGCLTRDYKAEAVALNRENIRAIKDN